MPRRVYNFGIHNIHIHTRGAWARVAGVWPGVVMKVGGGKQAREENVHPSVKSINAQRFVFTRELKKDGITRKTRKLLKLCVVVRRRRRRRRWSNKLGISPDLSIYHSYKQKQTNLLDLKQEKTKINLNSNLNIDIANITRR